MSAHKTIRVDVFSDYSCGWCYFAHRELEQGVALAQAANLPAEFKVQYHPYILHPALSEEPMPRKEFYHSKLGAEKWDAFAAIIARRAEQDGITFNLEGPISNTLRAQRLTQHAWAVGGQAAQQAVIGAILRAAFEEGKDIGNVAILADIAMSVSNDSEDDDAAVPDLFDDVEIARAWLSSSALAEQVRALSASAAAKGVAGVPCAVIDGRWVLAGCQAPQCYYKVFEKIATGHCSGTCPNLQKVAANGACSKTPTVLKADAGTMCGVPAGSAIITETMCTSVSGDQMQVQTTQVQATVKRDTEVTSPTPNLHAMAPTAVAI